MPYWRLFYHLVWATKHREHLIGTPEEAAIKQSVMMTIGDLELLPAPSDSCRITCI